MFYIRCPAGPVEGEEESAPYLDGEVPELFLDGEVVAVQLLTAIIIKLTGI